MPLGGPLPGRSVGDAVRRHEVRSRNRCAPYRRHMTVRPVAGFLLLLVGFAGCGSAPAPGPSASGTAQLPVGRTFEATGASEGGRDRPLAAKASIAFAADGTTSVATGCNTASAKTQLRDGKLVSVDGFVITARPPTSGSRSAWISPPERRQTS